MADGESQAPRTVSFRSVQTRGRMGPTRRETVDRRSQRTGLVGRPRPPDGEAHRRLPRNMPARDHRPARRGPLGGDPSGRLRQHGRRRQDNPSGRHPRNGRMATRGPGRERPDHRRAVRPLRRPGEEARPVPHLHHQLFDNPGEGTDRRRDLYQGKGNQEMAFGVHMVGRRP